MKKIEDNFWIGLALALVLAGLFFLLFNAVIPSTFGNPKTVYLFALVPDLILFRIFTVNLQRPKMGRALLLVTVLGIIASFIFVK